MKIIRAGGTNSSLSKDDPNYSKFGFGNYFMRQIKPELNDIIKVGGSVAVCVAAKANKNHYNDVLTDIGYHLDDLIILGRDDTADWSSYDAIMLLDGETSELHKWLTNTGFSIDRLDSCKLLAGDSAGAYVLGAKTIIDYEKDGTSVEIIDGFMPESNLLVAAHVNNPYYHLPSLSIALQDWCKNHDIDLMELEENQIEISSA